MSEVWSEVKNEVWSEVRNEVWNEVRNEVGNEVGNEVRNEVENEVVNEVVNEVRKEVWREIENEVGNEVGNEVRNEVRNEVWNEVRNEVGNEVKNFLFPYIYGSFDVWYSFYDFFDKEVFKLKKSKQFHTCAKMSKLGLTWCCKDFCVVSQKPSYINKNENGLHSENKPSLIYNGILGIKMYHIDGIKVPKWVFEEPKKLNVESIDAESNIEVRRVLIERYGVDKYLHKKNADVIDFEVGENITRGLIKINKNEKYLCGHDGSTNRVYYMSVNPNSKTCKEAHEGISFLKESLCVGQG